MLPPLQWLYQRLISVNKYRYLGDLMRGSNYWKTDLPRANPPAAVVEAEGPFNLGEGFKRGRNHRLVRAQKRPAAAPP